MLSNLLKEQKKVLNFNNVILNLTYVGSAITTIFNAAPGLAGLKKEFYKYSDILCVNETEVYMHNYLYTVVTNIDL